MLLPSLPRHEFKRCGIHAISQVRGLGTIIEDVAQVRIAFGARHCGPDHAIARVSNTADILGRDRSPKAWPARSRIKLRF